MLEKIKEKKKWLIIIIPLLVILASLTIELKRENDVESIECSFSSDYSYFDVTVNDFYKKMKQELSNGNIKVDNLQNDENDYEWFIEVDNDDIISIYSDDGGDSINKIQYNFSENIDGRNAGYFLGVMSRLFISNIDTDDFSNKVLTFFEDETVWQKEKSEYVYNHILYTLDIDFTYDKKDIEDIYFTFSVVDETTNEEYIKNKEEQARQLEELLKEQELKKQQEEEERLKKEQEEKERLEAELKAKERTFTAGMYVVGRDIDVGTYNMIAVSGRGNCYVRNSYGISTVVETFKPGGDEYAIEKYNNVELSSGYTIEVDSTLKIKFEPVK